MLRQIFSTDKKFWTQQQSDEVEVFFQSNPLFSKFYQKQNFQKLISICFYTKISKKTPLLLQNNKLPEMIVLLSGKVDICKKVYRQKVKKMKKKKNQLIEIKETETFVDYELFKALTQETQTTKVGFDCQISALDENDAEVLFVPSQLYQEFMNNLEKSKIDIIIKELMKLFPKIQKKILKNLAKQACSLKELKINDYVYKTGSQPLKVYFLLNGHIRLEKPKNTIKKTSIDAVSVQSPSIFGQKDIKLSQRLSSAVICSAYARILVINKKQFLRFAKEYMKNLKFQEEVQEKDYALPFLKSNRNSLYLLQQKPKLNRFGSNNQIIENEKLIETKLILNSHALINLSPKKNKTSRFDGRKSDASQDYTKDQFEQKIKLFHKIRPNAKKIDFNNPIINLTFKKGSKSFRNSLGNLSD